MIGPSLYITAYCLLFGASTFPGAFLFGASTFAVVFPVSLLFRRDRWR